MTKKPSSASRLVSQEPHSEYTLILHSPSIRISTDTAPTLGLCALIHYISHTQTSTAHLAFTYPGTYPHQSHFPRT
jgi:hypothetical protein